MHPPAFVHPACLCDHASKTFRPSVIAGGPSPIIASWLLGLFPAAPGFPNACYIAICAAIAFIATLFLTDYSRKEIHEEYAHVGD